MYSAQITAIRFTASKAKPGDSVCVGGFRVRDSTGNVVNMDVKSTSESSYRSVEFKAISFINNVRNPSAVWCSDPRYVNGIPSNGVGESVTIELNTPISLFHSYNLGWYFGQHNPVDWKLEGKIKSEWHILDYETDHEFQGTKQEKDIFYVDRNHNYFFQKYYLRINPSKFDS